MCVRFYLLALLYNFIYKVIILIFFINNFYLEKTSNSEQLIPHFLYRNKVNFNQETDQK